MDDKINEIELGNRNGNIKYYTGKLMSISWIKYDEGKFAENEQEYEQVWKEYFKDLLI